MRGLVIVGVITCAAWFVLLLAGESEGAGLVGVFGFLLIVGGLVSKQRRAE